VYIIAQSQLMSIHQNPAKSSSYITPRLSESETDITPRSSISDIIYPG